MPTGDLYSVTYPLTGFTTFGLSTSPVAGFSGVPGGTQRTCLMEIVPGDNPVRIHRISITCPILTGGGLVLQVQVAVCAGPGTGNDVYLGAFSPNGLGVINHINYGLGVATQATPTFRAFILRQTSPPIQPNTGPNFALSYFEESHGWHWIPSPEDRPSVDPTGNPLTVWIGESAIIPTGVVCQCSMIVEEL